MTRNCAEPLDGIATQPLPLRFAYWDALTMTTTSAPAGWYLDPLDATRRRYWTGDQWSPTNDPIKGATPPTAPSGLPAPPPKPPLRGAKGTPNPKSAVICPHCQVRGKVTVTQEKVKRGISGAKATGALVTAGLSVLGTGLSRKETVNRMSCGNCRVTWIA